MIVIPARLKSTRFPNKVLAKIDGIPMVIKTANQVKEIDEVLIATDSKEVAKVADDFGYRAVLTKDDHKSGTDRINEAINALDLPDDEVVLNVQADEPFIEKDVVLSLYNRVQKAIKNQEEFMIVSCCKKISPKKAEDPNIVKVVLNKKNEAIYFSRSKIPYDREKIEYFLGHLGLYGFSKKTLNDFCSLSHSPLEDIEKLEQLRAIYYGKKILMIEVESQSFGIDTKEDYHKALKKVE